MVKVFKSETCQRRGARRTPLQGFHSRLFIPIALSENLRIAVDVRTRKSRTYRRFRRGDEAFLATICRRIVFSGVRVRQPAPCDLIKKGSGRDGEETADPKTVASGRSVQKSPLQNKNKIKKEKEIASVQAAVRPQSSAPATEGETTALLALYPRNRQPYIPLWHQASVCAGATSRPERSKQRRRHASSPRHSRT